MLMYMQIDWQWVFSKGVFSEDVDTFRENSISNQAEITPSLANSRVLKQTNRLSDILGYSCATLVHNIKPNRFNFIWIYYKAEFDVRNYFIKYKRPSDFILPLDITVGGNSSLLPYPLRGKTAIAHVRICYVIDFPEKKIYMQASEPLIMYPVLTF